MKYPDDGPSGGTLPPISILAPAVVARSIIARMRRRDFSEITGPSCVRGSAGSPTRIDAAFAPNFTRNVGKIERWTRMRDPHTQVWPAAMKAANAAPFTARSISICPNEGTENYAHGDSGAAATSRYDR